MSKKEIVRILMRRDGISENEAWNIVEECQEEVNYVIETCGSYDEVVGVIEDILGLEPDYMDAFIM